MLNYWCKLQQVLTNIFQIIEAVGIKVLQELK